MPKRSSKKDFAQNALRVVEISTGAPLKPREKNPAAVALGRLGGLKGGKKRREKLMLLSTKLGPTLPVNSGPTVE
jgi:hypothetical protein